MTTFADRVYELGGVPVGGYFSMGKAWFVRPGTGTDQNKGDKPTRALKSLSAALTKATRGDVVYLISESNSASGTTDYQSATLDWNKDGVHLIGVDAAPTIGQRARIGQLSTVKTIDTLLKVSANNCLIANIEIFQGVASSTATAPIALEVTGERNRIYNCQISGNGDASMDVAGARSLKVSGGENLFERCYIGLDTLIRGTQTAEVELSAGARHIFKDCILNTYTSLTTFKILLCGTPDRFVLLDNCKLVAANGITNAVSPTGAIDSGSINGRVLVHHSAVYGCTNVTTADDSKTLVSAPAGGLVDMGLATSVDIA